MDIRKRIRHLMKQQGWTGYKLSKEAGLSDSTVRNILSRDGIPSVPTIEALCHAFKITLPEFFAESGSPHILTSEHEKLLSKWETLTDNQKICLLNLMDSM